MLWASGICERVALDPTARSPSIRRSSSRAVSASPWPRASAGSAAPRSTSGAPLTYRPPASHVTSRRPTIRRSVASPGTATRSS